MVDGASYAAAHVSGLYALIRARNPAARGRSILVIAHPGDTIDACATLIKMSGPCACGCSAPRELLASLPK